MEVVQNIGYFAIRVKNSKIASKNSWANLGIFVDIFYVMVMALTSTQPTGRIGSQKFSEKLNSKKSEFKKRNKATWRMCVLKG